MKIEIENLGPIKKFEFDIEKDLHIIYGENNIGKSYAISAVYVLIKHLVTRTFNFSNFMFKYITKSEEYKVQEIEDLINILNSKLADEKYREFPITKECENILINIFEDEYIPAVKKGFKNLFSNYANMRNKLNNRQFVLKILMPTFDLIIKLSKNNELYIDDVQLKKRITVRFISTNREIKIKEDKITLYVNKTDFDHLKFGQEIISLCDYKIEFSIDTLQQKIDEIYFLPASRSGLYQAMNIFSSVFAELSQMRHAVNSRIDIPALSEPVSDYFLGLSTIKNNKSLDKYATIATEIEEELLNGKVIFNQETKKIEYVENKTNLRLDLSETSSMVSEISPIVAYLKYVINEVSTKDDKSNNNQPPKKLIFIEEPEAHLHPKNQIKLIEYFTKLVNNDVKIVLTTHSDFISNKITNLILSKELSADKISSCHLVMTKEGSIDNGDMQATEDGIEDYNFLSVSEDLYEERMKLSNPEN